MDELTAEGIAVLIPADSTKRKTARPGWQRGRYSFMRSVLAGPAARTWSIAGWRGMVEPATRRLKPGGVGSAVVGTQAIQLTVDRDLSLAKRASDLRQLRKVRRALPSVPGAQPDTRRFTVVI